MYCILRLLHVFLIQIVNRNYPSLIDLLTTRKCSAIYKLLIILMTKFISLCVNYIYQIAYMTDKRCEFYIQTRIISTAYVIHYCRYIPYVLKPREHYWFRSYIEIVKFSRCVQM